MNKKLKRILLVILIIVLCMAIVCTLPVMLLCGLVCAMAVVEHNFSDPLNFRDYRAEFDLVKDEIYRAYGENFDGERAGAWIYYDKETDAYVVSVASYETSYRIPTSEEAYNAAQLIDTEAFYSGNNMYLSGVFVYDNRVVFESLEGKLALIWSPDGKPKNYVFKLMPEGTVLCDKTYVRSLGDDWYFVMRDKTPTLEDFKSIAELYYDELFDLPAFGRGKTSKTSQRRML